MQTVEEVISTTIVEEDTDVKQRVANGATYLDEIRPGWAYEIDLDTFEISQSNRCVLGQLYGWWKTGYHIIYGDAEADERGQAHGFDRDYGPNDNSFSVEAEWTELQNAWVTEIRRRQLS